MNLTTAVNNRFALFVTTALGFVVVMLGTAALSQADPVYAPTTSVTAPVQHPAFPNQDNAPQPGTQTHHDHQNNHG